MICASTYIPSQSNTYEVIQIILNENAVSTKVAVALTSNSPTRNVIPYTINPGERVGRLSDVEGMRLGLHGRLATGLGLEAADGAEGEGRHSTGLRNNLGVLVACRRSWEGRA